MTKAALFNLPQNTRVEIEGKLYRVENRTSTTITFSGIMHCEYLTLNLKDSKRVNLPAAR